LFTGQSEAGIPEEGDIPDELEANLKHGASAGETLTDEDIENMLAEVNCKVRKIVHAETARHVYFWSADANARRGAIELAYKIKGRITNKVRVEGEGLFAPGAGLTIKVVDGRDKPQPQS